MVHKTQKIHKTWSDFNTPKTFRQMTADRTLDRKLEQLLAETNFDKEVERFLAKVKKIIEYSGGDSKLGLEGLESILYSLRESIKHSMIPGSIISQFPSTL